MKINMLSNTFAHDKGSTANKPPKHVVWDFNTQVNPISVYIDKDVVRGLNDKKSDIKILWLLESRHYSGGANQFVKNNINSVINEFNEIWTHDIELINLHDKFKWTPAYGSFIKEPKIYKKTKRISMITSNKMFTEQQKFRVKYAIENKNLLDLYGKGFKEIKHKEEGLKDYMYSVSIENDTYDTYFTEKIIDCFMTGTIPIYKGTNKIIDLFNKDSILFLDKIENLNILSEDYYYENFKSIQENYELSQEFDILDDWIYKKHLIKYS